MMSVAIQLQSLEVQSPHQVEMLRMIRNAGRGGYSHDHHEISRDEQRKWWGDMQHRIQAWLYATIDGQVVGFGLIRQTDDGRWSPSAGVLHEHQGHGYGGKIVDDLVDRARARGIQLHAQALLDQPAAVATHHQDRWERLGSDEQYVYFRSIPGRPHA